jgi:hypothetical protein
VRGPLCCSCPASKALEAKFHYPDAAAAEIDNRPDLELFANPSCGVVAWRPRFGDVDAIAAAAPKGLVSTAHARDQRWLRFVAANPNAELERIVGFLTSLRL